MLGLVGAERLAEGLVVPVVQMGEEEETTWAVPRAVVSTVPVVLSMGRGGR